MAAILVIEEDDSVRQSVTVWLLGLGHSVEAYTQAGLARAALEDREFDVVLTEVRLQDDDDGIALCAEVAGNHPDLPVVLMSAFGDARTVARGMRAGAVDFLEKPLSQNELGGAVDRALSRRRTSERLLRLTAPIEESDDGAIPSLVGSSRAMRDVARRVRQVSRQSAPVLVTGETGTGKELIARAIHELSVRRGGPFVALNCAAIPSEMIESELFGHAQGAFTGAFRSHGGVFRAADRGTLFLDEVGAMPVGLQARLLRAIEQRAVRPVGTVEEAVVDVRVVAATNARLREVAQSGEFRSDLLYRLSAFEIEVPPLRLRENDVSELSLYFLRLLSPTSAPEIAPEAQVALRAYSWPGNVRELENCIRAALAISPGGALELSDLPARVQNAVHGGGETPHSASVELDAVERRHIERVLRDVGGNRSEAARQLGIDRVTLYRKMKRYRVG